MLTEWTLLSHLITSRELTSLSTALTKDNWKEKTRTAWRRLGTHAMMSSNNSVQRRLLAVLTRPLLLASSQSLRRRTETLWSHLPLVARQSLILWSRVEDSSPITRIISWSRKSPLKILWVLTQSLPLGSRENPPTILPPFVLITHPQAPPPFLFRQLVEVWANPTQPTSALCRVAVREMMETAKS